MLDNKKTVFRRIHGRIVPISVVSGSGTQGGPMRAKRNLTQRAGQATFGAGLIVSGVALDAGSLSKAATNVGQKFYTSAMNHTLKATVAKMGGAQKVASKHIFKGKMLARGARGLLGIAKGAAYVAKHRRAFLLGGAGLGVAGLGLLKVGARHRSDQTRALNAGRL